MAQQDGLERVALEGDFDVRRSSTVIAVGILRETISRYMANVREQPAYLLTLDLKEHTLEY